MSAAEIFLTILAIFGFAMLLFAIYRDDRWGD